MLLKTARVNLIKRGKPTMLDWDKYIEIADRFQHKTEAKDREDLENTIILRLVQIASNNGHKSFTEAAMCRIASFEIANCWVDTIQTY